MSQNETQAEASITTCQQESVMGRITFGEMYLELPIDGQHTANRNVLGVLGREIKESDTDKPIFTFQQSGHWFRYI
ncbi:MAG: hypothetical protein GY801_22220 [bacterium]|nr:hypothetical protein [bacterium]